MLVAFGAGCRSNGNVSLTGVVPTAADRARAEEIARSVNGVTQMTNILQTETK